jgi:hypothetical protein
LRLGLDDQMIDLKFMAVMDFVAWLQGRYPRKTESGGAEEFVPYEDARHADAEIVEAPDADAPASAPVVETRPTPRSDRPD